MRASIFAVLVLAAGCHDLSAIKPARNADGGDAAQEQVDNDGQDVAVEHPGIAGNDGNGDALDATPNTDGGEARVQLDAGPDVPPASVIGTVFHYESLDSIPYITGADLDVWNVAVAGPGGPTDVTSPRTTSLADGSFRLTDIPAGAISELWARPTPSNDVLPNGKALALSLRTHVSMRMPQTLPLQQDVPLVSYAWMAQVAVDCGLYPTLDAALYAPDAGTTNDDFVTRSVVFGELQESNGEPYKGPAIGVGDITISVGADMDKEFPNKVGSGLDTTYPPPAQVCFLDRNVTTHQYVGSKSATSTPANRFVMFRVRNNNKYATGNGNAVVHVTGFAPSSVYLLASGGVGVVSVRVGADPMPPPTVTFDDVYALLKSGSLHCVSACHTPPDGAGYVGSTPRGAMNAKLDFSTKDAALASLMAGETASCVGDAVTGIAPAVARLCPGDPSRSLLLTVPLTRQDNTQHPFPVFDSTKDPNYLLIKQWITLLPPP